MFEDTMKIIKKTFETQCNHRENNINTLYIRANHIQHIEKLSKHNKNNKHEESEINTKSSKEKANKQI